MELGAGIREQMSPGNTHYYNKFTIDWLIELLTSLSVNKLPEDKRKFVLRTGTYGKIQLDKAIASNVALFIPNRTELRIYKTGGKNGLGYMGQFEEFKGPAVIEVSVEVDPLYDDIVRNKIFKNGSKGRAESFRYDILDVGYTSGVPNIQLVYKKNEMEVFGYETGLRNPLEPLGTKGGMTKMSTSEDSYTFHRMAWMAAKVHNPVNCMQLIPAELQ